MTEGTSPRARLRAGLINYVSTLTALRESTRQLGDAIRLELAEYDRLTSGSLGIDTALNAWRYSTTVVNDALSNLEGAHAAFEALTPDVLRILRDAEGRLAPEDGATP